MCDLCLNHFIPEFIFVFPTYFVDVGGKLCLVSLTRYSAFSEHLSVQCLGKLKIPLNRLSELQSCSVVVVQQS